MRYFALLLLVAAGADPSKPEIKSSGEYSPDALKFFGTKVQPIFANACAACHSTAGCGSFSLRRVTPGSAIPTATTQFNIAAVAGQIDKKNPERSQLLIKAIAAHGGLRQPPIKDAKAAPYKILEQWVRLVANNGKASADSKDSNKPADPFDPAIFNNKNG